ncbi:hypothetical protein DPV73_18060 [Leptospira mayottensis]|nr:hypothetical protein DPV73_18060 [Leptospira mayottensis]
MNSIEFSFYCFALLMKKTFFAFFTLRRANRKLNPAPNGSRDNAPLLFGNLASYGALDSAN